MLCHCPGPLESRTWVHCIRFCRKRFGEALVRTPGYEPCTTIRDTELLLEKRLASVDILVASPQEVLQTPIPQQQSGAFPLLDPITLNKEPVHRWVSILGLGGSQVWKMGGAVEKPTRLHGVITCNLNLCCNGNFRYYFRSSLISVPARVSESVQLINLPDLKNVALCSGVLVAIVSITRTRSHKQQ
jgi:hypothetical protein